MRSRQEALQAPDVHHHHHHSTGGKLKLNICRNLLGTNLESVNVANIFPSSNNIQLHYKLVPLVVCKLPIPLTHTFTILL